MRQCRFDIMECAHAIMVDSVLESEVPGGMGTSHLVELLPSQYSDFPGSKSTDVVEGEGTHGTSLAHGRTGMGLRGDGDIVLEDSSMSGSDCCVQSI